MRRLCLAFHTLPCPQELGFPASAPGKQPPTSGSRGGSAWTPAGNPSQADGSFRSAPGDQGSLLRRRCARPRPWPPPPTTLQQRGRVRPLPVRISPNPTPATRGFPARSWFTRVSLESSPGGPSRFPRRFGARSDLFMYVCILSSFTF